MSVRWFAVLLALAAFGAGAWMLLRPPEMPPFPTAIAPAAEPAQPARAPSSSGLAASAVLKIDPRHRSAGANVRVAKASLHGEYLKAKNLRSLYDRLKATAEGQTPEGQYLLYEIARRCATVTGGNVRRPFTRQLPNRDEFVNNLAASDPMRDKRIAAFDEIDTKRCAGFDGVTITQAELNGLLASAVNGGDAKARALAIEQSLWAQRREGVRMDQVSLSDAQVSDLKQILGTRDPGAMVVAGRILSNTWGDLTVRIDPDGAVVEPRAFFNAWQTLACDYGYPCGSDNQRVLTECALNGHCQAQSLQDYLYYYGGSPHDSQLVAQYEQVLRNAVETGDWSQVNVVRGPRPNTGQRFFFGPGHGR
jgi:hypothetical protein